MDEYRAQLDAIDEQIVELLGKRFEVVRAIGDYKRAHRLPIRDPGRESEIVRRLGELARAHQVDPQLVDNIYELIFESARSSQHGGRLE